MEEATQSNFPEIHITREGGARVEDSSEQSHGRVAMSRREVFAPIAAVTAATAFSMPSFAAENDDEELMRLDAEFRVLYEDYLKLEIEVGERLDLVELKVPMTGATLKEHFRMRKEMGADKLIDIGDGKAEVIDRLIKKIRGIETKSIVGLAVKASLLPFDIMRLEQQIEIQNGTSMKELDWDTEQLWRYVSEMRTTAGLPPLFKASAEDSKAPTPSDLIHLNGSNVEPSAKFLMLEAYKTWLMYECRFLHWEMAAMPEFIRAYRLEGSRSERTRAVAASYADIGQSGSYHVPDEHFLPSKRAALVLCAVGCDWRAEA